MTLVSRESSNILSPGRPGIDSRRGLNKSREKSFPTGDRAGERIPRKSGSPANPKKTKKAFGKFLRDKTSPVRVFVEDRGGLDAGLVKSREKSFAAVGRRAKSARDESRNEGLPAAAERLFGSDSDGPGFRGKGARAFSSGFQKTSGPVFPAGLASKTTLFEGFFVSGNRGRFGGPLT
jgi:hypothetical protein